MKRLALLLLPGLILTACVSKKKYAALEAELETLKTKSAIKEVNNNVETLTAQEYEETMRDMQQEMDEIYKRMEIAMESYEAASGEPFNPDEMQRMLNEGHHRNDHAPGAGDEKTQAMRQELEKQETRMRFTRQAFEKVAKNYTASQMQVTQTDGRLVVSISRDLLFSGDNTELSPSGLTAVNRLAAAFLVENNFQVLVLGVEEGAPSATTNSRAYQLATAIGERSEAAGKTLLPSSITCDKAFGQFASCDRFEIVLQQNYEAAVSNLRYKPSYDTDE